MAELKPCPFCDGEAVLEEAYISRTLQAYKVYCKNYSCLGYYINQSFNSKDKAIAAWNKRGGK